MITTTRMLLLNQSKRTRPGDSSDIEQLASADSYEAALRFLEEKGWISSESDDVGAALKKQMVNAWKLLREVAPDISVLDFLIVRHDFHNIKAALKEFVSAAAFGFENSGGDNFLTPSIADPEQVRDAVRRFDTLPISRKTPPRRPMMC